MNPAHHSLRLPVYPARALGATLLLALIFLTTTAASAAGLASPSPKPRSVVFILSDDHRYDAMGFMGHPFLETPHLDRLAASGAHLKNAVVTTALCSPSRASILTGLYTTRHRVIDNNRPVPAGTKFFPELLQAAGYATAYIGKWHMGDATDAPQPGFHHWVSFAGQGTYSPEGESLNVDGARVPRRGYVTDELTDYAVAWLKEQKPEKQPFFLFLSHKGVHANFVPAARHQGRYRQAKVTLPETPLGATSWMANKPRWVRDQRNSWHGVDFPYHSDLDVRDYYRAYCETLLSVDDSVGRVLATLEEMGILNETLVIYMGDNGFLFGEQGLIDKRVAYEPSIRVPLLMHCPALIPPGTAVEAVAANIDIAPTILDVAGVSTPPRMDGRSLLPLLRGEKVPWRDAFLYVYYWEQNYPQTPTQFAIRTDRFKYITPYGLWDSDELYDLKSDPDEKFNLAHDPTHAEQKRKLSARLYQMLAEVGGMEIPLNTPDGEIRALRLSAKDSAKPADFVPPTLTPVAVPSRPSTR